MKAILIIVFVFIASTSMILLHAQNPVSYHYDYDGNMEARYVVILRANISEHEEVSMKSTSIDLSDHKITIHPNPTKGQICVEMSSLKLDEENFLRVFDSSGRLLQTLKIESEQTFVEISGAPGVYLLNIHLGTNISKWKIIKQ